MKCECPYTLKVPLGNAFQVLFPVKTAEWKDGERTVEVADVRALTDIVVKVDGDEWQDWEMDEFKIFAPRFLKQSGLPYDQYIDETNLRGNEWCHFGYKDRKSRQRRQNLITTDGKSYQMLQ